MVLNDWKINLEDTHKSWIKMYGCDSNGDPTVRVDSDFASFSFAIDLGTSAGSGDWLSISKNPILSSTLKEHVGAKWFLYLVPYNYDLFAKVMDGENNYA